MLVPRVKDSQFKPHWHQNLFWGQANLEFLKFTWESLNQENTNTNTTTNMNSNFKNTNKRSSDCNICTDCRQCKIKASCVFFISILFLNLKTFLLYRMNSEGSSSGREFPWSCSTRGWNIVSIVLPLVTRSNGPKAKQIINQFCVLFVLSFCDTISKHEGVHIIKTHTLICQFGIVSS